VTDAESAMKIVVLDVETTGTEKATDQIIELCLRFGLGPDATARTWRLQPEAPIHPEATKVHGITAEMLVGCPRFPAAAEEFLPLITDADMIVGYNVAFDLDMIQAELARAEIPPMALTGKKIVDVLRLWHHVEPRTLTAAHAKFCGETHENAHQASADVTATARVLESMLAAFGLTDKPLTEIASMSDPFANRASWIGPSPHIQWDASGGVIFGFGKYKGQQVSAADGGFLRWLLARDFPPHVKKICRVALERRRQFTIWIEQYYPRPVAKETHPMVADEPDPFQGEAPAQGVLL
jgi:DNA polymerase-3 subunit epsilon